jgi:hypothetical protein
MKEQLFARGEDKIRAAVDALQHLVLKFHFERCSLHPMPETTQTSYLARVDPESLPPQANALDISPGLGPHVELRRGLLLYNLLRARKWATTWRGSP